MDSCVVSGTRRSGTCLMARLLSSSPYLEVEHDRDHGTNRDFLAGRAVVAMIRNRRASEQSAAWAAMPEHPTRCDTIKGLKGYRPILWVRYEDLCKEPQKNMNRVCSWLGIPSVLVEEQLINQNSKWLDGSGGDPIGPIIPGTIFY